MPNLRAQTLARAAQIVGSADVLAVQLGVPVELLNRYLRGDLPVPANIFLHASEFITQASVVDAAKTQTDQKPPADPGGA